MRKITILLFVLFLLSVTLVFAQTDTISTDRLQLNTAPCIVKSTASTGTPTGGNNCDVVLQTDGIWQRISGTWSQIFSTGQLSLTRGGTNASLTASNGGIVYSGSSALAILSGDASAGKMLRSGASAAPTWSTATWPSTATTTGGYLRADGTNWITSTLVLPNAATQYTIPYASTTNTWGESANLTFTGTALTVPEIAAHTLNAQTVTATVGGAVEVIPTTYLTAALGNAVGDTTITVKHNSLVNGDFLLLQSVVGGSPAIEWLKVNCGGTCTPGGGAGAYTYPVLRDQDGSGRNAWAVGDALIDTGAASGSGWMELRSSTGLFGSLYGPTIEGLARTGTSYNSFASRWRTGNLRGWTSDYTTDTWGAGFGDPAATNITVDPSNGFRVRYGTTDVLKFDSAGSGALSGTLTAGGGNVTLNSSGITLGSSGSYSATNAYKFQKDANNASGRFGMYPVLVAGSQTLNIESAQSRSDTTAVNGAVALTATGWQVSGSATDAASISIGSAYTNDTSITLVGKKLLWSDVGGGNNLIDASSAPNIISFPQQPYARVYNSTATTALSTGSATTLTWNSEADDATGMHSTSSNTERINIAANAGGKYQIEVQVEFSVTGADDGSGLSYIRYVDVVNSSGNVVCKQSNMWHMVTGYNATLHLSCIVPLASSSYVYARALAVFSGNTTNVVGGGSSSDYKTYMSVTKIH